MTIVLHGEASRDVQSGKLYFVGGKWVAGGSCDYVIATSKRLGHLQKITLEMENPSAESDVIIEEVVFLFNILCTLVTKTTVFCYIFVFFSRYSRPISCQERSSVLQLMIVFRVTFKPQTPATFLPKVRPQNSNQ